MNKHTRLLVSVLFAVIVMLAIGITRFYMDVSQNESGSSNTAEIVRRLETDDNKNRIFEDVSGLFGILDSNDRIAVAPEWDALCFSGNGRCIASKRINGKLLSGCIDYEGNTVIPFIYKNISEHNFEEFTFYVAETDADGSYVIYDKDFTPCFMRSWDGCIINDGSIILNSNQCSYTYTYGENGFVCTLADVKGETLDIGFNISISSRLLLSKLNSFMLETISDGISGYISYALSNDQAYLDDIADAGRFADFKPLFQDDGKIVSKSLMGITDVFLYSEKSESNTRSYAVSIITDVLIRYIGSDDAIKTLRSPCRAVMKFSVSSSGITAVSGEFQNSTPDYPDYEETESQTEASTAAAQ